MKFKVGDLIKGTESNSYGITNMKMTKGKVLEIDGSQMNIEILEHKNEGEKGKTFWVSNNECDFSLIINEKPSIEELKNMPIGTRITIDREDDNVLVKVEEDELEFYSVKQDENLDSYDINDDLTIDEDWNDETTKIIKIEKPIEYETVYEYFEEEKKEMTIAEIEKELGYSVKIVKETKE